jgi:hypothetical protein
MVGKSGGIQPKIMYLEKTKHQLLLEKLLLAEDLSTTR